MKIRVVQKMDEAYFREFYAEWLKFRSVLKKWENKIGFLSMTIALLVYFFDKSLWYISFGFFVFGLLMVYEFYSSKQKWMKARLGSKMTDQSMTMIFEEHQVQSLGPFTEVNGKWDFFKQVIKTEKGLFLIPENGISIYLQKTSFDNPLDIEKIIQKIEANQG